MASIAPADGSEPHPFALDGRRIEGRWWGRARAGAPAVVLLHEGLGSVGLWRGFPAALAASAGCGVFAYSRWGYGWSDTAALPRPLSYMHDEAALLPRVLDAAGVGPCVLLGHSDGASIAAIHAGTAPDARLRGLALIAPHFFVEDVSVASIAAIRQEYERGELRARLARHHADVDAAFLGWNGAWLDPAFRRWHITAELARIALPMLVVQGTADAYGTTAQPAAAARLARGGATVAMVEGAGHAPHLERPDTTLPIVETFIRECLPRA